MKRREFLGAVAATGLAASAPLQAQAPIRRREPGQAGPVADRLRRRHQAVVRRSVPRGRAPRRPRLRFDQRGGLADAAQARAQADAGQHRRRGLSQRHHPPGGARQDRGVDSPAHRPVREERGAHHHHRRRAAEGHALRAGGRERRSVPQPHQGPARGAQRHDRHREHEQPAHRPAVRARGSGVRALGLGDRAVRARQLTQREDRVRPLPPADHGRRHRRAAEGASQVDRAHPRGGRARAATRSTPPRS